MPEPRVEISRRRARQLAVMGQRLDAPRPRSIDDVLAALGEIQMDPTSVVARTEHLVLFSRLGASFRVSQLERRMWTDRAMFEYWAHIVPMSDLPLHRISMKRYPHGHWKRHQYVRDWLAANDAFVRYALRELRLHGPLRTSLHPLSVAPFVALQIVNHRGGLDSVLAKEPERIALE